MTTSPRALLDTAHKTAAPAMGRLSLILASGRGLTLSSVREMAEALEQAAGELRSILEPVKEAA